MTSTIELASSVLYRRLLSFVAPYWRVFALAIAVTATPTRCVINSSRPRLILGTTQISILNLRRVL